MRCHAFRGIGEKEEYVISLLPPFSDFGLELALRYSVVGVSGFFAHLSLGIKRQREMCDFVLGNVIRNLEMRFGLLNVINAA